MRGIANAAITVGLMYAANRFLIQPVVQVKLTEPAFVTAIIIAVMVCLSVVIPFCLIKK